MVVLDSQGLPETRPLRTVEGFGQALRLVFGDDEAMMTAFGRDDFSEVMKRLWPYAHGFGSGGVVMNCEYTAAAITLERIQQALDDPDGTVATKLAIDIRKYRSAERFYYWIQQRRYWLTKEDSRV